MIFDGLGSFLMTETHYSTSFLYFCGHKDAFAIIFFYAWPFV